MYWRTETANTALRRSAELHQEWKKHPKHASKKCNLKVKNMQKKSSYERVCTVHICAQKRTMPLSHQTKTGQKENKKAKQLVVFLLGGLQRLICELTQQRYAALHPVVRGGAMRNWERNIQEVIGRVALQ